MTDYASLAEACALLPGGPTLRDYVAPAVGPPIVVLVTATVPTATQGASILASVTAEINMHLRGRGYSVPATDADAIASLKTIAMNGAAARIGKAMPSKDDALLENLRTDYKEGLAFIDAGGLSADSESEDGSGISYDFTRPYDVLGSANNGDTDSPF
jgi:hypothetical protein